MEYRRVSLIEYVLIIDLIIVILWVFIGSVQKIPDNGHNLIEYHDLAPIDHLKICQTFVLPDIIEILFGC